MDKAKKAAQVKAWHEKNAERVREYKRLWRIKNLERLRAKDKAYREQNQEAKRAKDKAYYAANRDTIAVKSVAQRKAYNQRPEVKAAKLAHARNRQATIINRTPAWADTKKIKEIYELAQQYRDLGLDVHVDHYYPLRGRKVSGLHVHNNLRVMLAWENTAKGNSEPIDGG